jgi:hypothetical protein
MDIAFSAAVEAHRHENPLDTLCMATIPVNHPHDALPARCRKTQVKIPPTDNYPKFSITRAKAHLKQADRFPL